MRQRLFTPALAIGFAAVGGIGTIGGAQGATGAAPGDLVASPASLDLGPTAVGATSTVTQIAVTNEGGVAQAIGMNGSPIDAVNFVVVFNACTGVTLAPDETCVISYAFRPSSAEAKSTTASVGNAASNVTISLSGTGVSNVRGTTTPGTTTPGTTTPGTTTPSTSTPGTSTTSTTDAPSSTTDAPDSTSTTPVARTPTTAVGGGLANTGPSSSSTIAFAALLVLVAGAVMLMVVRRVAR